MKKYILLLALTAPLTQGASAQGFLGNLRDKVLPRQEQQAEKQTASQTTAPAQLTPESVIAGCPALPSVTDLIDITGYGNSENENYNRFHIRLGEYQKSCSEAFERAQLAAKAKADEALSAQVKDQTGKSLEEWQGMNKEELEREGEAVANTKLKAMGINKSVSQIEKMSDAEKEALGRQMGAAMTGLTVEEMNKISNMSDEEAMAYLQSTGALERMMGKMFVNMPTAEESEDAEKRAARIEELQTFTHDYQEKLRVEREQWREKELAVHTDGRKLWNDKYRPKVIELEKQIAAIIQSTIDEGEAVEATNPINKKINEQHRLYYTEVVPMWRNHVLARMEYEKNGITEARKYDEAYKELMKMTANEAEIAMAQLVNSAMVCAFAYMEVAGSIHNFPTAGPGLIQSADGKD